MKSFRFYILLILAILFSRSSFSAGTVIHQHPRDIPTYPATGQSFRGVKTRIAVYPLPVVGEMLTQALTNDGCRVVTALPQCGMRMEERPDCILEPISLTSKTERDGERVNLVTVLLVRVRKPVAISENAQGSTFQGASRISLGYRKSNDLGETTTSQQEIDEGIKLAVANLLRIPSLKVAIEGMKN